MNLKLGPLPCLLLGLLLAVGTPVAAAPQACACSCAALSTAQAVERAGAVFLGEVIRTDDPEGQGPTIASDRQVTHTVAVTAVYKGTAGPSVRISSAAEGLSCGLEVVAGQQYLFFVDGSLSTFTGTLCAGTRPSSRSDIAAIEAVTGPGRVLSPPIAVVPTPGSTQSAVGGSGKATPQPSGPTPPPSHDPVGNGQVSPGVPLLTILACLLAGVLGTAWWRRGSSG